MYTRDEKIQAAEQTIQKIKCISKMLTETAVLLEIVLSDAEPTEEDPDSYMKRELIKS